MFDAPVSPRRGVPASPAPGRYRREDVRIASAAWPAIEGADALTGRCRPRSCGTTSARTLNAHPGAESGPAATGLHPADDFEAARHEGMMQHVEDLRAVVSPTIRMGVPRKKAGTRGLGAGFLPGPGEICGAEHLGPAVLRWATLHDRGLGSSTMAVAGHRARSTTLLPRSRTAYRKLIGVHRRRFATTPAVSLGTPGR